MDLVARGDFENNCIFIKVLVIIIILRSRTATKTSCLSTPSA